MNETQRAINPRYRLMAFAVVVFALSVLSFHGALDSFAHGRVTETTKESVGIYAVSRAINSGISVLTTTQVKVPLLASLQLGEVLDPINDGIERLSTTVVWAIGSLFVQRIVLEVASSMLFQWVFAGSGLIALFALLPLGSTRLRDISCQVSGFSPVTLNGFCKGLIRVFVFAAVLRFIVPVFVGSSFLVSEMLLQPELDRSRDELKIMSRQVAIDTDIASSTRPELAQQRDEKTRELAGLQKSKSDYEKELGDMDAKIDALNEKAGVGRFIPEMLGGRSPDRGVIPLRAKSEDLRSKVDDVAQRMVTTKNELECIDRRREGKSCGSLLDRLTDASKIGIENISNIADAANDFVVLIANVLIVLFVKNILFPVLFLVIAMKCGAYIVRCGVRLKLGLQQELAETQGGLRRIEGDGRGR